MIRVQLADEPPEFDAEVRQPGLLALRELAGDPSVPKRRGRPRVNPPALWTRALPQMRVSYRRVCAYLGLYVHRHVRDTIDHFIARDTDPSLAYEWRNFRYSLFDVNRLKGTKVFLDPFEVEDEWFELDLMTFRVRGREGTPHDTDTAWRNTLAVLNEPTFCDARRWYHERYFGRRLDAFDPEEPMPLSILEAQAPFVARALRRQGRLRPEDTALRG